MKRQFEIFYHFLSSRQQESILRSDDFDYKKNGQTTHSLLYQCISQNQMEHAKNIATFKPYLLASPVYTTGLNSTNALFLSIQK